MEKIELASVRDMGQTIGDSLLFIRQNFKTIMRLFVYYLLGPLLVASALSAFGLKGLFKSSNTITYGSGIGFAPSLYIVAWYLILLILSVLQNVYTASYMIVYEQNREAALSDVWQHIKANAGRIVLTYLAFIPVLVYFILSFVLVIWLGDAVSRSFGGLVGLVLWGFLFYAMVPLSNVYFIRLREKLGIFQSFGKAFSISAGGWWRTFTGFLITSIVYYAFAVTLLIPFWIVAFVGIYSSQKSGVYNDPFSDGSLMSIYLTIAMFWSMLLMHILYVFIGTNYFSLSEKYDHFHLRREIEQIGVQTGRHIQKQEGDF